MPNLVDVDQAVARKRTEEIAAAQVKVFSMSPLDETSGNSRGTDSMDLHRFGKIVEDLETEVN